MIYLNAASFVVAMIVVAIAIIRERSGLAAFAAFWAGFNICLLLVKP